MEEKQSLTTRLKSFVIQSKRVWHIMKKPSGVEFKTISKVSAIGILILGAVGFLIATIMNIFS